LDIQNLLSSATIAKIYCLLLGSIKKDQASKVSLRLRSVDIKPLRSEKYYNLKLKIIQKMNAIIASTSTIHGSGYLEYLKPVLTEHFKDVSQILFVPYARPSGLTHEEYASKAKEGLAFLNVEVKGLHEFKDQSQAIQSAEAIFVGGGNTFLLVKTLHELNVMDVLKQKILTGTPYLGTSAGSNICGPNMQTTNDMPIVMPASFETLGVIPFNINAHYIEPNPQSKHKGETRRTRIKEFQMFNDVNVLGLKEGSWLEAKEDTITLKGKLNAVWFEPGQEPKTIQPETLIQS
jgi:dipeptidase E